MQFALITGSISEVTLLKMVYIKGVSNNMF